MNMTPIEIVEFLDGYIVGQKDAKRVIAIALRNRWRRMQLPKEIQDEVLPKNILLIGPTGVGKTEIARRMAKMMGLPFVKVEASKFTEVGFVGRDVESMVRDLVYAAINLVKEEEISKLEAQIDEYVIDKITKKLLPEPPKFATEHRQDEYKNSFAKMQERVVSGAADELKIEVQLNKKSADLNESNLPPEIIKIQESFSKILGGMEKSEIKKEVTVKEAKELLRAEATEALLDIERVKQDAIKRAQSGGIIFVDEIDKIAVSSKSQGRNDPSKEGVQRDLLPIVEGSVVHTKFGSVATDHILFIAAGAFHLSKPSDLIPELQGRFPLRVELNSLDEEALYKILTTTKNSLLVQYEELLQVEKVTLIFEDDAIKEIAKLSQRANEKTEDIGARRLHTVIEKVVEDISFEAPQRTGETVRISKEFVQNKLSDIVENVDLARYIL